MGGFLTLEHSVGVGLILGGVLVRVVAIWSLMPNATGKVATPTRLIKTGLYRWIRHPMYLGSCLTFAGIAIGFMSWEGRILMVLMCYLFFYDRMDREEFLLSSAFGSEFEQYAKKTWRLLPFVY